MLKMKVWAEIYKANTSSAVVKIPISNKAKNIKQNRDII